MESVTHEDWERARKTRNAAALVAVRHLLRGDSAGAMESARESAAADDEMDRITDVLDRRGNA
jgi:hypothetical protein